MTESDFQIVPFEEALEMPLKSYVVADEYGGNVVLNPKGPNHKSFHPEQSHPSVFHNLGLVITNYDSKAPTTSTTPETQEKLADGDVMLYKSNDFFRKLNVPGWDYMYPDWTATVVVLYPHDNKDAYSLTYYFDRQIP